MPHDHNGEKNPNAKLTPEKVALIRRGLEAGLSIRKIACVFGVSKSTIGYIRTGHTWQDRLDGGNDKSGTEGQVGFPGQGPGESGSEAAA